MEFRPCIDIHNGKVKQIVGGSLQDKNNQAKENFVAKQDAAYYAALYRDAGIRGGHIILLNPVDSEYYEATKKQALSALSTYPGGLQVGGGITPENAGQFLEAGASHVIVTSYVFKDGRIHYNRLEELVKAVGRKLGNNHLNVAIGSALDLFGGSLSREKVRKLCGSCDRNLL